MQIVFKNNLGACPAYTDLDTGNIYLNAQSWPAIPTNIKTFILMHERAHYDLQTLDELAADELASKRYFAAGLPIDQSILAISEYLKGDKAIDYKRLYAQIDRAQREAARRKQPINLKFNLLK